MHWKNWGFGSFLEDEEIVLHVFRCPFMFTSGKMLTHLLGWGALAGTIWFFFPQRLILVWAGVALFALFRMLSVFFYWYMNGIVMTNIGLVIVDWPTFFCKRGNRINFFDLDQVGVEKIGFKSFLGNYGKIIFMQIGGVLTEVLNINRPHRVSRIIENYKEKAINNKNFTEESALKNLLSQLVLTHVKDHGIPDRDNPQEDKTPLPPVLATIPVEEGVDIDVEKVLDDEGGVGIDLDNTSKDKSMDL